jgi:hypothetical protein
MLYGPNDQPEYRLTRTVRAPIHGIMKTTVDIVDEELKDAIHRRQDQAGSDRRGHR